MPKYLKIEIDVSAHVQKYITYHLGKSSSSFNPNEEIKLDKNHHIGLFILSLLEKKQKLIKNKEEVKFNSKKINSKVKVLMAEHYEKEIDPRYYFLSVEGKGIKRLDLFIDGLFRQELYLYLNSYQMVTGVKRKIKEGLLLFYKKYSLTEDDIPSETLLRAYRRYRKKNKFLIIN